MPSIGNISGLCADYSQATYNGRPYDKIYERILNGQDFRFNEMMKRGGIPCELGHPTDYDPDGNPRTETDPTKVAVILTEVKKGGPQQLIANGKILDTPNGRIFKTLSEFYDFGLSSRGSYEIDTDDYSEVEGPNGWNQDSYVFKGYDLVLIPANIKSVLSVTEGVESPKKIVKVARESIDVNLLAKASQVSEEDVNLALDNLFKVNEEAKMAEEVTVPELKEKIEEVKAEEKGDEPNDKVEEVKETEVEEKKEESEPTLITDGESLEKIKADLETALDEIASLKESKEKDGLELSNRDAEITKLTSDNEDLKAELEERIAESEELSEKFKLLQDMSTKLLESYRKAKEKFEEGVKSAEAEESMKGEVEELKGKLDESQRKEAEATECLQKEKLISSHLRKELVAAKESLISNYSMAYGISEKALKNNLGKNYTVSGIKSAAESLSKQVVIPSMPIPTVARKRSSSTESLMATDEVEREILDQIKRNN